MGDQDLVQSAGNSPYVPTASTALRALVTSIPYVGGALDHLIFDKGDEIRRRNMESTLKSIGENVQKIGEDKVDKAWFQSEEALSLFSELISKIQFESSHSKIEALSKVYVSSGGHELRTDPHKFAVLDAVYKMTDVQRKLLLILAGMSPVPKKVSGGGIIMSATAIWLEDVEASVNSSSFGVFWTGILVIPLELEILETINLLRRVTMTGGTYGYVLTNLGRSVIKFLNS